MIAHFGIAEIRSKRSGLDPMSTSFEKVHPTCPQAFEKIWEKIETMAGRALESFNASPGVLSEADSDVTRALVAVHLVRSVAYIRCQRKRLLSFVETGGLSRLSLAEHDTTDEDFRENMRSNLVSGPYSPNAMGVLFPVVKARLSGTKCLLLWIPTSEPESSFLITAYSGLFRPLQLLRGGVF